MSVAEQQTVQQSTDPKALVHAAQVLASSDDSADHQALGAALLDADFLSRLDDDAAYDGPINRLRVARVLRTLAKHLDADRSAILVQLTSDPVFLQQDLRIDLLIKACAALRPSPPEVVSFWDAHCLPDDGFSNLTIAAAVANGSQPALDLFVAKLLDPAHDETDKLEWLRQDVLPHRQDLGVVRAGREALARGLSPPLDLALVQVFFDYNPEEWYRPATLREAPDRTELTRVVVDELLGLAAQAQGQVVLDNRTALVIRDFVRSYTP
jgi:hypothetical protein